MKKFLHLSMLASMITILTACGGDDDNHTTNHQSTQLATLASTPTPVNLTNKYRLDNQQTPTDQTSFINQLNELANQGYAFVKPVFNMTTMTNDLLSYQHDNTAKLEYKGDDQPLDINTLNMLGSQGYLYKLSYDKFHVYFKNINNKQIYSYQLSKNTEAFKTPHEFLTDINNAGKLGWRYHRQLNLMHNLYVKTNNISTFEYSIENKVNDFIHLELMLNNKAKDGWVYRGDLFVGGQFIHMFERPTNHKSFSCELAHTSPTEINLALMNEKAQSGYLSLGTQTLAGQTVEIFCKDLTNVSEPLNGSILPEL